MVESSLVVNHGEIISNGAPNLDDTPVVSEGGLCSSQPTPWKQPLENPSTDLASSECAIPEAEGE